MQVRECPRSHSLVVCASDSRPLSIFQKNLPFTPSGSAVVQRLSIQKLTDKGKHFLFIAMDNWQE